MASHQGKGTVLVVSAHAADFVWRAAGYIALSSRVGQRVVVVCLSFGERGESARLWKEPGITVSQVKKVRETEVSNAAEVLGAEVRCFDAGDYPLVATPELEDRLVQTMRELQPEIILAHSASDPYNLDHSVAAHLTLKCRIVAQAEGYPSRHPAIGAPQVLRFEPHQPEQCDFKPDCFVDITPVFDLKRHAMECMEAQEHLWYYYTELARRRGAQAVRNGGPSTIEYSEAYERVYPEIVSILT